MMNSYCRQNRISHQSGLATLLMSLVLIFIVSILTMYAAQSSVIEQKISANHYRAKQSFHAAQTGLDMIIANLPNNIVNQKIFIENRSLNHGELKQVGVNLPDIPKDENGQSQGHYKVTILRSIDNSDKIDIISHGFSGDNVSEIPNQVLQQSILLTPIIAYQPSAALITKLSVTIQSESAIIRNTTASRQVAIWSGENISLKTSDNIEVVSGTGRVSNEETQLSGLTDNDFFENFFAESPLTFRRNSSQVITCSDDCILEDMISLNSDEDKPIIWLDTYDSDTKSYARIENNEKFKLGSLEDPILLVINGQLEINHPDTMITGLIYFTSDVTMNNAKGKIIGSLISNGSVQLGGNILIEYNAEVLNTLIQKTARFVNLAGSWRDF